MIYIRRGARDGGVDIDLITVLHMGQWELTRHLTIQLL